MSPTNNPATEKIVAIIQARMGSKRLPGKVLAEIAGKPMLAWVVERTRRAKTINQVIVATTDDPSDDAVAVLCAQRGYPSFRGSTLDVLDRYYQAARAFHASVIVRITGDCPLIDPGVIDETVFAFLNADVDFAANRLPPPHRRTYPIGLDVEVCTFAALEQAWQEAHQSHQREHVMPYLYEQEGRFRVRLVNHDPDFGHLRWAVDTHEDLALMRQIFAYFPGQENFSWMDVLELFRREPDLANINAHIHQPHFRQSEQPPEHHP